MVYIEDTEAKKNPQSKGWTLLLFTVCVASTLGTAVPVGYCLSVVNTPSDYIKEWYKALYHMEDNNVELLWAGIVSLYLVGGMFGSFISAWFCDKCGRRGTLLISAILLTFGGAFFVFCRIANTVVLLFLGRFICGIAAAFTFTALPMYLLEIAPINLRGTVNVFTALGVVGGICIGQVVSLSSITGNEDNWHFALSAYTLLAFVCFLPSYWYPESPRWYYLVKNNPDAAKSELLRLRPIDDVEYIKLELMEMAEAAKNVIEKRSFVGVLRDSELLLPMVLVCSFQATQPLSGINAIWFYSITIFKKAGFDTSDAEMLNLGAGFLNFVVVLFGPLLMTHFNRRPLMLISCLGSGLTLIAMAFALKYIDFAAWLPITAIVLIAAFIIVFNLGLCPIPYFIGSELFEVEPRPVAMSMGSLCSWSGNFIIGMIFPTMQSAWGPFAFLPSSVICLLCFCLTLFYLPETRGKDASYLKDLMKNGFKSKVK